MMKKKLSRTEAQKRIDDLFKRETFTQDELRKVRRLAMKYNLKLGKYRSRFCKSCLSQLKGKIRISKTKQEIYKTIVCHKCNYNNRFKIN